MVEIEVNDKNFEKEVIEKSKDVPVLVDFWADWCGPCKILNPIMEKIAEEYDGRLIVAKADVEKTHKISDKYNVLSIPCIKIFKNGKVEDGFVGARPAEEIKEFIKENLA
jgi:putative thioredoxin